jgi:hypothetical protein
MSIYLAAQSPNPATTHPIFKQRGLDGLTHAAINNLGIHGRAYLREAAYDGYYRNIDIFLCATNRQERIPTYTKDAELTMSKITDMIPIKMPKVFILPVIELTPDQQDTFMHKLRDCEPIKHVRGKTTAFILTKPDVRQAMTYLNSTKEGVIAADDTWTPGTFAAMSFLQVVITEFLKTNTYPAFLAENNRGEFDGGSFIMDHQKWEDITTQNDYEVKRMRGDPFPELGDEYDSDNEKDDADMEHDVLEIDFSSMRKAVLVAKPSPLPLSYNIGEPSEVPNLPGRVFPYFDKMNTPDNHTIRNIVSTFFLRNLGEDRTSQINQFKAFKTNWEHLAKTKQGGELVHILVGIKLALETQTRLFLVYREECYSGFVLLGALWSVIVDNRVYEWESAEKVQEQVALMSSHHYAVRMITETLSKCSVMVGPHEGPAVEVTVDQVPSAVAMWNKIKERKMTVAESDTIKKFLGLVAYSRTYREVNAESMSWFFRAVGDPAKYALSEKDPLFLPPHFALYQDDLFQLLCTFGPDAPSLYNTTGSLFSIPSPTALDDPNNVRNQKGERALPVLLVSLKSVQTAYQDLRKVLKDKEIRINLQERAGRNRNIVLRGDGRDKVYQELKECLVSFEKTGSKRKSEEPQTSKKAKRLDMKTADDFLNLFK